MHRPIIGITVSDTYAAGSGVARYCQSAAYSAAIVNAGGVPIHLSHEQGLVGEYLSCCDGFVLSGGDDPHMEPFGEPSHPSANLISERRQSFELALLSSLAGSPEKPVLGICLGMQLMALHAGAKLIQHLPEAIPNSEIHLNDNRHRIEWCVDRSALSLPSPVDAKLLEVVSWHHQGIAPDKGGQTSGGMRIVAVAQDGVVEAVDDPSRAFYMGVQWHPERGGDGVLGTGLFRSLVDACRRTRSSAG